MSLSGFLCWANRHLSGQRLVHAEAENAAAARALKEAIGLLQRAASDHADASV